MQEDVYQSPWTSDGLKLFLLGFITLFLELALIRYLAGNIWNLGYFPNLVLMAVFVGMGIGFIFHRYISARISPVIFQIAFLILLILVLFVYYRHPMVPGLGLQGNEIGGELFFTNILIKPGKESYFPFIVCFAAVILIFAFISQRTAKLFRLFKPLTAYSLDISGSCAGILSFMIASRFQLPAYLWFGIASVIFPFTMPGAWKKRFIPILAGLVVVIFSYKQDLKLLSYPSYQGDLNVFWSPYQKIEKIGLVIFVNGVGHQRMDTSPGIKDSFYQGIYTYRQSKPELPPYKNILVIGAGTGNDVAAALMNDARHVDAVEIDPVIAKLGKIYHPSKPYDDPRVNLVVDDGRAFITNTKEKYDLIVFALTDSAVKVSSMSQLRLENYLFTVEAIKKAYSLLTENGNIIFYNLYRRPWLVDKICGIIYQATGRYPEVLVEPQPPSYFAVIEVGKKSGSGAARKFSSEAVAPATDDWPFLYLKEKGIPTIYKTAIILMFGFVGGIFILHIAADKRLQAGEWRNFSMRLAFLFMGMAFMLLETKSVIQFSLLFGATWLNNSLVFLAILILVLAANWTAILFRGREPLLPIYVLLLFSSLSTIVFPLGNLLKLESGLARFVIAGLLTFSPIYFANLIFSITFRDQQTAEQLFGWNLLGATVGGITEYSSMLLGYTLLSVIVAACYTLVFIFIIISRRENAQTSISP